MNYSLNIIIVFSQGLQFATSMYQLLKMHLPLIEARCMHGCLDIVWVPTVQAVK